MRNRARLTLPEPLAAFSASLAAILPDAEVKVDRPRDVEGEWWLDVVCNDFRSAIAWRAHEGFGVFTHPPEFGDRPDEVYQPPALAAQRLGQLYGSWKTSAQSPSPWLSEIRQLRGTAQTALAEKLSQSQAAISQLERREDIRLSTLRRYVAAMGGRLELRVVFDDFSASVGVGVRDEESDRED